MKNMVLDKNKIRLMVYDFDGVMTDNRVLQLQDGTEAVWVSRADGWGVDQIRKSGISQIILSTEKNPVVTTRAKKLNIEAIQGSGDKKADLLAYCDKRQIDPSNVLYVGNDVNDLEAMQSVGFPIAPADAHPSILRVACFVTKVCGGDGVIKELSEIILSKE